MKKLNTVIFLCLIALILLSACSDSSSPDRIEVPTSQESQNDTERPSLPEPVSESAVESASEMHSGTVNEMESANSELNDEKIADEPITGTYTVSGNLTEASGETVSLEFQYQEVEPEGWVKSFHVTSMISFDSKLHQTIEFEASFGQGMQEWVEVNWQLIDVNFDGYADIFCLVSTANPSGNRFFQAWLYDPDTNLFVLDTISGIDQMSIRKVNSAYQVVESQWYTGHTGHWHEAYQYQEDKTLRMVAALNITGNEDGLGVYKEYEVVADEKVLVFEIEVTEENKQAIQNRYYNPADQGFWYLGEE